jgi:hypothetical protein
VLDGGIAAEPDEMDWERTGFALATGYDGQRFEGLTLPPNSRFGQITDSTFLVRPDLALAQHNADVEAKAKAAAAAAAAAGGGRPMEAPVSPARESARTG